MLNRQARIPTRLSAVRVRQLQLFSSVAQVGSISEAARRLHVTQPAATEMLKELEKAFAVPLISRGPRGIALTPQGRRVAARASAALHELEWAIGESESQQPERETLRVGFVPTALYGRLAHSIDRFQHSWPQVRLNLREMNAQDCADALVESEVDMALTINHPQLTEVDGPNEILLRPCVDDRLIGFVSSALIARAPDQNLSPQELSRLPWILPLTESFIRSVFDQWFFTKGVAPPVAVIELSPLTASMELLRVVPCAALLPQRVLTAQQFSHLTPLAGGAPEVETKLVVACKRWQLNRPAVSALADFLVDDHTFTAARS